MNKPIPLDAYTIDITAPVAGNYKNGTLNIDVTYNDDMQTDRVGQGPMWWYKIKGTTDADQDWSESSHNYFSTDHRAFEGIRNIPPGTYTFSAGIDSPNTDRWNSVSTEGIEVIVKD